MEEEKDIASPSGREDEAQTPPDKAPSGLPATDAQLKPRSDYGKSIGGDSTYINYSAHLYTDPWEKTPRNKGEGEPLYKSIGGRVLTRTVSRGLFGAAFMTLGNVMVHTWDPYAPVEGMRFFHRGMRGISKGLDLVVGTPIKAVFGEEAVTFRTKKNFSPTRINEAIEKTLAGEKVPITYINGRSLGQEMVGVTFDFAAGSFGDALGRELISVADPNYHKDWLKDGHVNFGSLARSIGKSLWRMVTYNQMEDWAAALPYVYQMRAQRHILGQSWPGSKFTIDDQNNGGAFVVNNEGQIKGSYMTAGALDLQARFMGYNFYTLMFRDVYNHSAMKLKEWKNDGYAVQLHVPAHPGRALEHAVEETAKYVTKSFIKSMLYMAPAVPFFWMFRTPQSRANGMFVSDQENVGVIVKGQTFGVERGEDGINYFKAVKTDDGKTITSALSRDLLRVGEITKGDWRDGVLYRQGEPMDFRLHGQKVSPEHLRPDFDPYDGKYSHNLFERILNPFGKLTRAVSQTLDKRLLEPASNIPMVKNIVGHSDYLQSLIKDYPHIINRYNVSNTYVNAAMSYTPYMIMKYETANHIDMPLFDAAAYRFLDGIDTLKWKDIKEGVHDMASVVVRGPISEGTLEAAKKPRGLINSSSEASARDEQHQKELREERRTAKEHKAKEIVSKKGVGWTAYEAARAQGKENTPPEGVTIH